ncbi:MAG: hypothetical protein C5B50_21340 [Verrucomicrobia bacterium]|nr:MAG: hypothetical protein C5B50_21340 [Verrucomicrobiota bacterium]
MAQKSRPCLILSINFLEHERAVVTYIPRTLSLRSTRFEIAHQMKGLETGAFDVQGIGSVPTAKLERRLGTVEAVPQLPKWKPPSSSGLRWADCRKIEAASKGGLSATK